jgi:hypothetical protein
MDFLWAYNEILNVILNVLWFQDSVHLAQYLFIINIPQNILQILDITVNPDRI